MSSGRKLTDVLVESALIVFGILLGLYFQSLADKREVEAKKEIALSRVIKEISHNKDVVAEAVQNHELIIRRLSHSDSIQAYLSKKPFDIRRVLGAQPIYKVYPRATSWNAANASGIVAEFDFTHLELLTDNYSLQQNVIDQVSAVADIILNSSTQDPQATMNGLLMNMQELAGREKLLVMNYEQILRLITTDTKNN
ncbi:hypothetical protein WBG78_04315 [Chryseolinea sp. T2]|uniref:hypothetical protein n=1 Tax=Chryseolinea sp. T2 TaxID=3129255 RepID=UPI0030787C9E